MAQKFSGGQIWPTLSYWLIKNEGTKNFGILYFQNAR